MMFYLFLNLILVQKERSDMSNRSNSSNLHRAKKAKNDEFYTRNTDIENELKYYRDQFRDKIIYCNCDDPVESEFYRYFHLNFHFFGMKKLISTHYDKHKSTYALIYQGGTSEVSDNDYNSYDKKIPLKENGDFRSPESIAYLKQADIVVTNPPFSLYREYVAQLMKYHKQFIIIGNKNSVACREIFPLMMNNKMWEGVNSVKEFIQPDGSIKKLGNVGWFTNMPIKKPTDQVILWNHFSQREFPTYDNYCAFECSKVAHIPVDKEIDAWIGADKLEYFRKQYQTDLSVKKEKKDQVLVHIKRPIWGVPITFLDKYNPSSLKYTKATDLAQQHNLARQFDILGCSQRHCHDKLVESKTYEDYKEVRHDGSLTGSSGTKTNGNPNIVGIPKRGNYFVAENKPEIHSLYNRIFIRAKSEN